MLLQSNKTRDITLKRHSFQLKRGDILIPLMLLILVLVAALCVGKENIFVLLRNWLKGVLLFLCKNYS